MSSTCLSLFLDDGSSRGWRAERPVEESHTTYSPKSDGTFISLVPATEDLKDQLETVPTNWSKEQFDKKRDRDLGAYLSWAEKVESEINRHRLIGIKGHGSKADTLDSLYKEASESMIPLLDKRFQISLTANSEGRDDEILINTGKDLDASLTRQNERHTFLQPQYNHKADDTLWTNLTTAEKDQKVKYWSSVLAEKQPLGADHEVERLLVSSMKSDSDPDWWARNGLEVPTK